MRQVVSGVCDDEQLVRSFSRDELNDLWTLTEPPPPPADADGLLPSARFAHASGALAHDPKLSSLLASEEVGPWVTALHAQ